MAEILLEILLRSKDLSLELIGVCNREPRVVPSMAGNHMPAVELPPDGKRLLMMPVIDTEGSATQVHVVLNFLTELRQRLR